MLEAVNKANAADPREGELMGGRHLARVRRLTSLSRVTRTSLAGGKHFLTRAYISADILAP